MASSIKTVILSAFNTKTGLTSIAGLATALTTYLSGGMTAAQAIQTAVTCLIGLFLRSAVATGATSSAPPSTPQER
jgi:hypothetical protein